MIVNAVGENYFGDSGYFSFGYDKMKRQHPMLCVQKLREVLNEDVSHQTVYQILMEEGEPTHEELFPLSNTSTHPGYYAEAMRSKRVRQCNTNRGPHERSREDGSIGTSSNGSGRTPWSERDRKRRCHPRREA